MIRLSLISFRLMVVKFILLSNDGELSVSTHFYDTAWLMLFLALAVILYDIINRFLYFVADFIERAWCWLSADVGAGADYGFLKSETQFFAEFFSCDAYASTAILSDEVGRKP